MAAKTIDMSKLRKVIKFYVQGKSKVFISSYLGLSRNTVKKYIKQFSGLKLTFEELDKLTDVELDELFSIQKEKELSPKMQDLESFFPYVDKELKKTGKTLVLLWLEYKAKYPNGFQSIFPIHQRIFT